MALNDVKYPVDPAPYKAKQIQGNLPEYDAMRARLQQRSNADVQQQQDAMERRFAAQGGLNSGAALKQQQLIAESGAQNREASMEGINNQETAEQRRLQEAENQKEFQSNESYAQREFQDKWNQINQGNTERQLALAQQESEFNRLSALSQMDDDQLLGMGAAGDAYRERKASNKGAMDNAKNVEEDRKRLAALGTSVG